MTTRTFVSDELLGKIARRQNDLFRRIREGSVPAIWALDRMQEIIENRAAPLLSSNIQVEVGAHGDLSALLENLKAGQYYLGGAAEALMQTEAFRKSLSCRRKRYYILLRKLGDFHIHAPVSREYLFSVAQSSDLELCTPEMGPLLRLEYQHSTEGEDIRIGMLPLAQANGELSVFHVTNNTGQGNKLNVLLGDMKMRVATNEVWAFCRPI